MPSKSWCGLVDFEWNDGEWSYKENLEDAQVSIADLNGNDTQLQILEPQEAKKMLGAFFGNGWE